MNIDLDLANKLYNTYLRNKTKDGSLVKGSINVLFSDNLTDTVEDRNAWIAVAKHVEALQNNEEELKEILILLFKKEAICLGENKFNNAIESLIGPSSENIKLAISKLSNLIPNASKLMLESLTLKEYLHVLTTVKTLDDFNKVKLDNISAFNPTTGDVEQYEIVVNALRAKLTYEIAIDKAKQCSGSVIWDGVLNNITNPRKL